MLVMHSQNAEILAQIHAVCFPDGWSITSFENLLKSQGVLAWLVEGSGFLLTRTVADEMEVLTIAVRPEARRSGIATQLMRAALEHAREAGGQKCFLEVDKCNVPAIRCYEQLGFSVISTRKDYYKTKDGRSDALLMHRVL